MAAQNGAAFHPSRDPLPLEITEEDLVATGVIRRLKDGVRLLAKGDAPKKVKITVTGASKAAVEAIEKAGGKVTLTGPVPTEKAD